KEAFVLKATAKLPSCPPLFPFLKYEWTCNQNIPLDPISKYTPSLYIAPYSLQPGVEYQFTLTVEVWSLLGGLRGSAQVSATITVASTPLVVTISGGKHRVATLVSTLLLDASGSYDPDWVFGNLGGKWSWRCCTVNIGACDFNDCNEKFKNFLQPKPVLLKISTGANPFPVGTYEFEVTLELNDKEGKATTRVTFEDGSFPNVQIEKLTEVQNPKRALILRGIVPHLLVK